MRIVPRIIGVLVVVAVVAEREAAAQAGWGAAPDTISPVYANGVNMLAAKVGVDAAGNAVAVWVETGTSVDGIVVKSARYDKASGAWGTPVALSDNRAPTVDDPQIAVDAAGNAVATWSATGGSVVSKARAARFTAASGTWTEVPLSGDITGRALVAANPAGEAVIVWNDLAGGGFSPALSLQAIRYSADTATWSAKEPLATTLATPPIAGDVGIDGAGDIHVVWLGQSTAQATRFAAASGTWGGVVDLSAPLTNLAVSPPHLAVNTAGDALVSWSRISTIEAARWPAGGGAWEPPVTVATTGAADTTRTGIDPAGNAVVVWTNNTGSSARQLLAARYSPATTTWSAATPLSAGAFVLGFPSVALDPQGNAFVAWTQQMPPTGGAPLFAARYAAAAGTWSVTPPLSAAAQTAFNPDIGADPVGNALVVWHQTAGAFAATQALRWDATPPAPSLGGVVPDPRTLSVSFSLPSPTDPSLAPTALDYSLDGGATWTTRSPASATSPLVVTGLTDGIIYTLRIRLANAAGRGQPSSPLQVRSGSGTDPTDFRIVSRSGNLATFAWVGPRGGIVPTGYLIEGGISGQAQILASISTGGTATQITLSVPNGVFFARVAAVHGGIRLGQSAALQFSVNAGVFPSAPTNLLGSASGDRLALSWTNTWNGAALTGVRLEVSGPVFTSIDLPPTERFTFDGVPPGTYTFVVTSLISSVPGDASNVVTLTFPGACSATPGTPTAFSASAQAGRIYLDWLPPPAGAAVTHYVVHATGAFTGSFPLTARTFSAPVPPGSYSVSVSSAGPCGTSALTPAQTVVVP